MVADLSEHFQIGCQLADIQMEIKLSDELNSDKPTENFPKLFQGMS